MLIAPRFFKMKREKSRGENVEEDSPAILLKNLLTPLAILAIFLIAQRKRN